MTNTLTIIFAVLVAATVETNAIESHETDPIAAKAALKCLKETNATPEQGKILLNPEAIPSNDVESCYMECVYKTIGVIADGKFNLDNAHKLVDMRYKNEDENKKGRKIMSDCQVKAAAKEGEKCSFGKSVRACLVEESKKVDFFPGV